MSGLRKSLVAACLLSAAAAPASGQSFRTMGTTVFRCQSAATADAPEQRLATLRDDVRRLPAVEPVAPQPREPRRGHHPENRHLDRGDAWDWDEDAGVTGLCLMLSLWTVASPIWVPVVYTGDNLRQTGYFQRHPYDVTPGLIVRSDGEAGYPAAYAALAADLDDRANWIRPRLVQPRLRRWSGRLAAEYAGDLDDLERISGRLLLSTSSRFGLDSEMSYFQERLAGARRDSLWLGDCNVVFRFAQSEQLEWRVGLGFHWLDDSLRTDFGFNFTYGVDWFPRRPWVVSSEIDWGTLGRTDLFRFRVTCGAMLWGLESYAGYEYLDVGRTQAGSLIGGLRVWF